MNRKKERKTRMKSIERERALFRERLNGDDETNGCQDNDRILRFEKLGVAEFVFGRKKRKRKSEYGFAENIIQIQTQTR